MNELKILNGFNERSPFIIQLLIILFWGCQLLSGDAYYVVYAVILIIAVICTIKNRASGEKQFGLKHGKYVDVIINVFAILFSCMVAFANYKLWSFSVLPEDFGYKLKWCYHHFMRIMMLVGGYVAFKNIIIAIVRSIKCFIWNKGKNTIDYKTAFVCCFVILT